MTFPFMYSPNVIYVLTHPKILTNTPRLRHLHSGSNSSYCAAGCQPDFGACEYTLDSNEGRRFERRSTSTSTETVHYARSGTKYPLATVRTAVTSIVTVSTSTVVASPSSLHDRQLKGKHLHLHAHQAPHQYPPVPVPTSDASPGTAAARSEDIRSMENSIKKCGGLCQLFGCSHNEDDKCCSQWGYW